MKHTQTQGDRETGLASLLVGTTPGPWIALEPTTQGVAHVMDVTGRVIARDVGINASLIAAAPALAASHSQLVAALAATEETALELMIRAESIDAMLTEAKGIKRDCELGQIARMRSQLSRNRKALSDARNLSAGMEGGSK